MQSFTTRINKKLYLSSKVEISLLIYSKWEYIKSDLWSIRCFPFAPGYPPLRGLLSGAEGKESAWNAHMHITSRPSAADLSSVGHFPQHKDQRNECSNTQNVREATCCTIKRLNLSGSPCLCLPLQHPRARACGSDLESTFRISGFTLGDRLSTRGLKKQLRMTAQFWTLVTRSQTQESLDSLFPDTLCPTHQQNDVSFICKNTCRLTTSTATTLVQSFSY